MYFNYIIKREIIVITQENLEELFIFFCNLRYKIPKVLRNGSTYDYHFIIKYLPKDFDSQLECLEENTEKYINFSVSIKKKT